MPINVYTGLMRSGKSYEVVSQVIINAIAQGRRVVTNVDGISNDLVREYVAEKQKIDIDKLGVVSHVQNEDIFKPDFFPYYDDHHGEHTDTFVQPGDLVCVDEAWRFWGGDCKLHKHHKSFFLEHGHFTHPVTHVACDLVLMIQDMGTLHRFVKNVVAFSFRTHKKVSLGMGSTYSVTMWEGSKQTRATEIGNWVRRYQKEIFPLYSSFKGGAEGKTVNVDSRQNILANKRLWFMVIACVVGGFFAFRNIWHFFHPVDAKPPVAVSVTVPGVGGSPGGIPVGAPVSAPAFSSEWRYVGELRSGSMAYAVVASEGGRLRLESPSIFNGRGLVAVGMVDGRLVTSFSGHAAPAGGFLGASANPAPSSAPAGPPGGSPVLASPFAGDKK
jgi:zona occludens toxin